MSPIYYIKNGNLSFADNAIFAELEIYINRGDKVCLIGRNGCGKSSLLKVIAGDYELDNGESFHNSKTKIGYLNQEVKPNLDISIYNFILEEFSEGDVDQYLVDIILEKLGLDGNSNLSSCSGGQIRRAHLARTLVLQPDILLLDEPTNHLDISTIEWLEDFVKSYKGAIVCISHDKTFLSNVTNRIWWLDRGHLRKSDKGFKYFEEWREVIIEQEEAILRKLNKKLDGENDWLNAGVTARRKRNQKRLADLKALRETSREQANKLAVSKQRVQTEMTDNISKSRFIIEAENISFGYADKKLFNNFNFRLKKGEKIGVIGTNGSGKSTFIKLLTRQLAPQTGQVIHGTGLDIAYFDQHRSELNPLNTLQQTLCPTGGDQVFLPDKTMHVAGYLKQFMFDPQLLTAKVSILSGGEASRLLLAKTLINPGNLLILDEPTNDLDMDSLEILLEILGDYPGTLIVVSHDRDFLDRLVTRTLVFTGEEIIDLTGGYQDYQQFLTKTVNDKKALKKLAKTEIAAVSKNKKLSYKDQRLIETLPGEIENLEIKVKTLEHQLTDSTLYSSNPTKFNSVSNELVMHKNKLDESLTKWLELQD